jgi:xanthine dehydrogenase molybdenum-binding subunit
MAERPWTWIVPEYNENVKRSMSRQDAYDKVSGQAVYTRDLSMPGMLYGKILASPFAHAKIVSMDTSAAKALMGVRDILKYDDPDVRNEGGTGIDNAFNYSILTLPQTADFYQHPMGVVVVADTEEIAEKALKLIKIQWEERPFILEMEESAKPDAPKIMVDTWRFNPKAKEPNIVLTDETEIGDVKKAFRESDRVLEYSIKRAVNSPVGVESMACIAQWRNTSLDLWVHSQTNPQGQLSSPGMKVLHKGEAEPPTLTQWAKINVTFPYQGAWFGGLSWLAYSTLFIRLAVVLAKRSEGRPIKLMYDESSFYCGGDEAGTYTCKVGARKDGSILGYDWHMDGVRNPATDKTYECTNIANIRGTQTWAHSNIGHLACFRHGAASCVPHSIMFDLVAAEFGLDPTDVALRNDGCRGHDWEYITQYQKKYGFPQRHSLKEVLEIGKRAISWDQKRHAPGAKKLANGRMHGMGFMSVNQWHWGAGTIIAGSYASLIFLDGQVKIIGMRCDMGSDSESAYRCCVAAELGMKYDDVLVQEQRSDNSAFSLAQPAGSGGTVNATPQLACAARELKRKILERAAMTPMSGSEGTQPSPVNRRPEEFDIKDSMVFEIANPERKMPIRNISTGVFGSNPIIAQPDIHSPLTYTSKFITEPEIYVMSRQAHFIEAEVDVETGMAYVTNVVCVNDVGHIFNRQGAEAQQYGGAIMGLGKSATEEKIYCPKTGVGLNFDHINYQLGTMNDYPIVQCYLNESHLGYGPYGSNGIGENIGASLAAITSSAIYNAIGKRILDFPITPDKVLKALGMN